MRCVWFLFCMAQSLVLCLQAEECSGSFQLLNRLEYCDEYQDLCTCMTEDDLNDYLKKVESVVASYRTVENHATRIHAIENGLPILWREFINAEDADAGYRVMAAKTMWYVEDLMLRNLPSEKDLTYLEDQINGLYLYAQQSLSGQFPFLKKEVSETAEVAQSCMHETIRAALDPLINQPLNKAQIDYIKYCWDQRYTSYMRLWDERYSRDVVFYRAIGDQISQTKVKERFCQYCFSSMSMLIEGTLKSPPDDYLEVLKEEAVKRRLRTSTNRKDNDRQGEVSSFTDSGTVVTTWDIVFEAIFRDILNDRSTHK